MSTFDRVKKVVVEKLEVSEDEDSLDMVELVMGIETEFGVDIPDEDAEKIVKVQDAVSYIDSKS